MSALGVTADYFIKTASTNNNTWLLALGTLIYALTAFGWYEVLSCTTLSTVGVWYSTMTVVLLTAVGCFAFNEILTIKQFIGIICAVAAILLTA
ncbi:MAG: hypothetical protein PHD48_11115 [Alphaproteobacteria bacterium]|nr:hypothetical protein [Alphaproteobacteria bacterium]